MISSFSGKDFHRFHCFFHFQERIFTVFTVFFSFSEKDFHRFHWRAEVEWITEEHHLHKKQRERTNKDKLFSVKLNYFLVSLYPRMLQFQTGLHKSNIFLYLFLFLLPWKICHLLCVAIVLQFNLMILTFQTLIWMAFKYHFENNLDNFHYPGEICTEIEAFNNKIANWFCNRY